MDKKTYEGRDNCESRIKGNTPVTTVFSALGLDWAPLSPSCVHRGTRDRMSYGAWKDIGCWNGSFRHARGRKRLNFHCNSGRVLSRQLEYFVCSHTWSWLWALAIWNRISFSWLSWWVSGEMLSLFSVFFFFPSSMFILVASYNRCWD